MCPDCEANAARVAELERLVESLADKLATASAHLSLVAERVARASGTGPGTLLAGLDPGLFGEA